MTDNIIKLYELAGVGITRSCKKAPDAYCYDCDLWIDNKCTNPKILYHPPFTAEKQLGLIKWVATKQGYITIGYDSDYGYNCEVVNSNDCYESFCYYEPEYALCGLIIDLWKDLTDEQKAEIKRILQRQINR